MKGGQLALVARDFGESDSIAVEFMLANTALAFVNADSNGNLSTFNYQKSAPENRLYDPPGIRLVPLGFFHLGQTVRSSEVFSKLNLFIFGYFDPVNIFVDNINKYFSG